MKKLLALIAGALALTTFITSGKKASKPLPEPSPEVYVTIAADANFVRFSNPDSIRWYLDRCRESGFNHVVLDVKPVYGKVLYYSQYIPYLDYIEGVTEQPLGRDWDYLQFFIDECHKRDMRLSASFSIMPCGSPYWQRGLCYQDSVYDPWLAIEQRRDGSMHDMRDTRKAAAFLNPAMPAVQDYALKMIMELVNKYDIDGLSLDYCRYPDEESDFSDFSRQAFEQYIGQKVENWPADVFSYDADGNRVDGPLVNRWWTWRAKVISDLVHRASDSIHAAKPNVDVEYWAATWIHAIHRNGQNWASPKSQWSMAYSFGSPEYQATGFAPYLDVFAAGAYLERVHGADDNESIEYAYNRADTLLHGDCKLVGSLYAINHDNNPDNPNNMYNAATMSLNKTGNLRVFDISQIQQHGSWKAIKAAIDDYKRRVAKR